MSDVSRKKPLVVSTIIAHLNQPEHLRRCLVSLTQQSFDLSTVEIIVVDNGSHHLPREVMSDFPDVRLDVEATPGPGPARNRGVAASTAPILAFIDADCVAHPDWLATIVSKLGSATGLDIIGGKVLVGIKVPDHPTMIEAYEQVFSYRQRDYIAKQGFSGTGNLAMKREVYERVGPFGGIEIAEDRDWGQRAGQLGLVTHYVPEMIVTHPARKSMAEIYDKADRLLSHDYTQKATSFPGKLKWLIKALAVAASPLFSFLKVLQSKDLSSPRDRVLACKGLLLVRIYRSRKMFALLFTDGKARTANSWNR
jgi:glycosyltransferase involved in cell wall biosynthesis